MSKNTGNPNKCAEHGVWTAVPKAPPAGQKPLDFSTIDADENKQIISSGKMSFAMVGCSGDPEDGTQTKAVAHAIAADDSTSFFYHLGDIIYFEKGSDARQLARRTWTRLLCGTRSSTLLTRNIRSRLSLSLVIMTESPHR